jgi:hypothetical protein
MPYEIVQLAPLTFAVMNSQTRIFHSYHSSLEQAESNVRLLNYIDERFNQPVQKSEK